MRASVTVASSFSSDYNVTLNGPLFVQSPPNTPAAVTYIRTFDVISEVNCVLLGTMRRMRPIENIDRALSTFVFLRPRCFYATFSNLFLSKPLRFLLETKRSASFEDSIRFLALCDLPETFLLRIEYEPSK